MTTSTGTNDKSCASIFLSTLCLSDGPPLSAPTVGSWKLDASNGRPSGVISTAYHSSKTPWVSDDSIHPLVVLSMESTSRHVARVDSRMSERSSTRRFCKRRRRKEMEIQPLGSECTVMKVWRVFTTASRTFAIVWRKKGKRVGAS